MTALEPRRPDDSTGEPRRVDPETSSGMDVVSFGSGPVTGRLGKYDLVARLGQGGMAGVFLAVARAGVQDFRKLVVLKVLHENLRDNGEFIDMFVREAKIAADLAHPNVVHTYTVEETNGQYYLVMEYLDGVSLSEVLKKVRDWPLKKRLPLLGALCLALSGLHYVHNFRDIEGNHLGLVHRDFKPANIFITFDGQVKVLDFGVAKMTAPEAEETTGHAIKGTVQYISPEALDPHSKLDRRTDLFSAGLVAWEIAMGQRLWGDRDQLQIFRCLAAGDFPTMDEGASDLPDALFAMCQQALARQPSGRQSNALEFRRQIQAFLVGEGFRIDTEELGAMVRELFRPLHERRTATIRERLRTLADSDEERAREFAGSSPGLPLTQSLSKTAICERELSPSGTEVDISPSTQAAEPLTEQRRRGGGLWLFVALAAVSVLVLVVVSRGSDPADRTATAAPAAARPVADATRTSSAPAGAAGHTGPSPNAEAAPSAPPQPIDAQITVRVHVEPASAEILLDGEVLAGNPAQISGSDPNAKHALLVRALGFEAQQSTLRLDTSRDVSVTLLPTDEPVAASPRKRRPKRKVGNGAEAAQPAKPAKPASVPTKDERRAKPGDDIDVEPKRKSSSAIDEEISWGE